MIRGVDISVWQDDNSTPQRVDFTKMRQAKARFVFVKASQANWIDQDFVYNWDNAIRAGIPRGAYHYMTWDVNAIVQARYFGSLMKNSPGEIDPVLDYECVTGVPSQVNAWTAAWNFIQEVQQITGRRIMLYTSPGYWKAHGSTDERWKTVKLWLANYGVNAPNVPAPWGSWTFWQFGDIKGVGRNYGCESEDLDMNWYAGTEQLMRDEFHFNLPILEEDDAPALPKPKLFTVSVPSLRLRSSPTLASTTNVISTLPAGLELPVIETTEPDPATKLVHVRLEGWVAEKSGGQIYGKES